MGIFPKGSWQLPGASFACALLMAVGLFPDTAHAADLPVHKAEPFDRLPWKDRLPEENLSIRLIGPAHWSDEAFQYGRLFYKVAYSSVTAMCWPDTKVCPNSDEILCDIATTGAPEVIGGRQILVSKLTETQECLRHEDSRLRQSMHHMIIYRQGVRP
jgi:hypothetical protein